MPEEPEESFRQGMGALKAGNTAEALAHFQAAVTNGAIMAPRLMPM